MADQNLPGVALPGGFTLFQLPKPVEDRFASKPETVDTIDVATVDRALPPREAFLKFIKEADLDTNWLGLGVVNEGKKMSSNTSGEPGASVEPSSSSGLTSESDAVSSRQVESHLGVASDGECSDDSDYCGDEDVRLLVYQNSPHEILC